MIDLFIPYRCSECIFGEYLPEDSCWDSGCNAKTDEECEKLFAEDCTAKFVIAMRDSEV